MYFVTKKIQFILNPTKFFIDVTGLVYLVYVLLRPFTAGYQCIWFSTVTYDP